MKAEKNLTDSTWRWSGWAVVSIDGSKPYISYPIDSYDRIFAAYGARAIMIFDTEKDATEYKKFCQARSSEQKHRVVKAAFAMASALTDKERREIDARIRS